MRIETHHFGIGSADSVHTSSLNCRQVSLPVNQAAVRQAATASTPMRRRSVRARAGREIVEDQADMDVGAAPGHLRHGEEDHGGQQVAADVVGPGGGRGEEIAGRDLVAERRGQHADQRGGDDEARRRSVDRGDRTAVVGSGLARRHCPIACMSPAPARYPRRRRSRSGGVGVRQATRACAAPLSKTRCDTSATQRPWTGGCAHRGQCASLSVRRCRGVGVSGLTARPC